MLRFWLVMIVIFFALLFTVTYVSRRASQPDLAEDASAPTSGPPAPYPSTYEPAPRYSTEAASHSLYKCVDDAGHQSFQSQPCAGDAKQAWVRDATPVPEPRRAERHGQAQWEDRAASQPSAVIFSPGSGPSATAAAPDPGASSACRIARAADAAYRRQPLRYVTHDGLRQHGDRVNAACY